MIRITTVALACAAQFLVIGVPAPDLVHCAASDRSMYGAQPNITGLRMESSCCETIPKPRLIVWTSPACIPCRQFWSDFNGDAAFRAAMLSRFHLQWVDVDAHRIAAERGIVSVPTFDLGDRRVSGYQGKEWLWRELTALAEDDSASSTSVVEIVPESSDAAPETPLPPLPRLPRTRNAAPSEDAAGVDSRQERAEPALRLPMPTTHRPPHGRQDQFGYPPLWSGLREWTQRSVPLVLTGLEVAGILGGSAATGGAGTIALAALWRVWKRRRLRKQTRSRDSTDHDSTPRHGEEDTAMPRAPFPRRLDEARELLALRQSEGRVATLDALRGMFLDDELSKLAASSNENAAPLAAQLKSAIDARVDEVAPLSTRID